MITSTFLPAAAPPAPPPVLDDVPPAARPATTPSTTAISTITATSDSENLILTFEVMPSLLPRKRFLTPRQSRHASEICQERTFTRFLIPCRIDERGNVF